MLKKLIPFKIKNFILNQRGYMYYFNSKVYFPKDSILFHRTRKEVIYEKDAIHLITFFLKDNTYYIDIGCNIGLMSVPILNINKTIKVLSFEPSPNNFPYLLKTYNESQFKSRWKIFEIGLGEIKQQLEMSISDSKNGAYDSFKDTTRVLFKNKALIKIEKLDEIWEKENFPNISVIKCDIEGADFLALLGSKKCILKCRPVIFIEWNSTNIKPFGIKHEQIIDFCHQMNYKMYNYPNFNLISDSLDLYLKSIYEENFILFPNQMD